MMTPRAFGKLPSGDPVEAYTLTNAAGASAEVLTFGGIVTTLRVPDREGRLDDVVLGFNDLGGYLAGHIARYGAMVGRTAGRVPGGRLTVEGVAYELPLNETAHHLHGGHVGLDRRVWAAHPKGANSLRLTYRSPDGEEGYPGNLDIAVTYTLTEANALVVESEANADRVTPFSLAHHGYFNLAGEGSGTTVADHEFQVFAEAIVPLDEQRAPTARREPLAGHAADFTCPRPLGDPTPQRGLRSGDLYLLRAPAAPLPAAPTLAARLVEPRSGRVLEAWTDWPCLQFYTGSALDGSHVGKSGVAYGPHAGFCLECQGHPNGSALPEFGDILVHPGQPQRRRTVYAFSTV